MWTMFEQLIVQVAITALRLAIKNPKSVAEEGKIIADIALAATQADSSVNGTVWSSAPATAAPAAQV
jgi:hypothetical protein